MAKFVSLSFWITLAVYLALASPLAVGWIETWLAAKVPFLGSPVANLLTSRVVAGIIWGSIAVFVVAPGWRLLWKLPLAGTWLANRYFPDLNGEWVVTIQSNWPIMERLKTAASSNEITFDPLKDERPSLLGEAEGWKPTSPRGTKRTGRPDRAKEAKPSPAPSKTAQPRREATKESIKGQFKQQATQPETRPLDGPSLDEEKLARGHVLDEFKGNAKRPWESASFAKSQDNRRPKGFNNETSICILT